MQHQAPGRAAFVRRCFAFADRGRGGVLTGHDLKCAVAAALGIRPSKLMLAQLFDPSGDNEQQELQVDEELFSRVMLDRLRRVDLLEDVRRLFKALDVRAQGFLSLQSFQSVCASALPHLSTQTVQSAFQEADRDRDGRVTYQDFERLYLLALELQQRQDRRRLLCQ